MPEVNDPKLLEALERLFMTRSEMRQMLEYQQKLLNGLQELTSSHRAVHEHVRKLTDSHNRSQDEAGELLRTSDQVRDSLRRLDDSHSKTQGDIRQAIDAINYMQQEVRQIPRLEERLSKLEREVQKLWQDDKADDRRLEEQARTLKKVESRKHLL